MKKIKSYEDALKILGKEQPKYLNEMPKHEQAYHKLCTIADALNKGHDAEKYRIYIPTFYWGAISDFLYRGSCDGIQGIYARGRFTASLTNVSYRLCSYNQETAEYLGGIHFYPLWIDYMLGNE